MRTLVFPCALVVLSLSSAAACGDDETAPAPAGPDAAVPDVAAPDTGAPVDDAGAAADASSEAASDAGDSGVPLANLYSLIAGNLVTLDPTTGALVEIGPTGQNFAPMVWDVKANLARIVVDALTAPKLGTIDLCTGVVTPGLRMQVGADDLKMLEGFAQDPVGGTFYATVDLDNSVSTITEATATVDITTGVVTPIGTHTTLQNDGDVLMWAGTSLYLLDIATDQSKSGYYTINLGTGAATFVNEVTGSPLLYRFAEDRSRNKIFATYGTTNFQTRGLATIDLATGQMTNIGPALAAQTYAGNQFHTLMVAPEPTCP